MRERAEDLAELFENAPCGLILTSPRGDILAVNSTLLEWIDRPREGVLGRAFSQLMTVAGRIYYETHFAPLLRMQGFVREIAVDLVRRDGMAIPVFVSATEARSASGEPRSIRIAVFHASDRRQYERELLLARRMAEQGMKTKSDFLAVFAHEVRNGLQNVQLGTLLLEHVPLPPTATKPLATMRTSLERVIALLQNMLDFSKIEAGRAELEPRRFNLGDLLHGVAQTLQPAADRKSLPIRVEIGSGCPAFLIGDAVKIGQILTNLAGNAVKFTETGRVTLSAERVAIQNRAATVRFRIRDTGIGIPPDRIARIWDEFTQAGPEIKSRYGGFGLGLAISRRIVELHGSRLQVESTPGSGTTFWFDLSLPIADAAAEEAACSA